MSLDTRSPSNRSMDTPRDKPRVERIEHANLERPGAQFHPRAAGWQHAAPRSTAWPSC